MPRLTEAVRQKVLYDVRCLMSEQSAFHPERQYADAQFSGAAHAILARIATVLETGNPNAEPCLHGPTWVREMDDRWYAAMRGELSTASIPDTQTGPSASALGEPE